MENFDYYSGEDFNFDPILELQNQASGSSDTSHETFCSPATIRKLPGTQTTLFFFTNFTKNKEKADHDKNIYKRKKLSFTQEYFEKSINDKGDEIRICKILDESAQDDTAVSKKPQNSKITSFARNCHPHSKHIQKKHEELNFVVPGEQKIKTIIVKSYNYNWQNLQNLLTETAESVSLTMDLWSSRAKHGYLGITATWITPDFEIKICIKDWNLEQRVTSITTNNGSNMVAMSRLLNQKSGCEDVKHLSCTAYTIQLAIGKGKIRADTKKLDYIDIMHCIQDVSTHWNSTYYAWDCLFFLKDAIIQLQADLCTSTDRETRIFDLASEVPQNVGEFLDENTVFDSEIVETRPIDFDDDEVISNITKESISIKNSLYTTGSRPQLRYKTIVKILRDLIEIDTEKEQIIQKLRDKIGKVVVQESETLNNPASSIDIESSIHSHKEYCQRRQSKTKKAIPNMVICDEVMNYLSLPLALETENPLDWWQIRSQNFPKLATSVSSERLFSDAGNLISTKRTSLDTKLAG
ncbi:unnamed protein product [Rhizophagus irregularis]|nr:unnamed protein product [Rhizophagus irregularis]